MASWSRLALLLLLSMRLTYSTITEIRLVGGLTPHEGTVEYKRDGNNNWESTCGVNLGINDVVVICRHLGFPGANRAVTNTIFAPSSPPGSILQCTQDDVTLADCEVFNKNCDTGDIGAAICYGDGYLGCFQDSSGDRVLDDDRQINNSMSISLCLEFCRASGSDHQYAGLENGNECYCGAPGTNYSRIAVGTDLNCQSKCYGSSESCGGIAYIAVFDLFKDETTTTPSILVTKGTRIGGTSPHPEVTSTRARFTVSQKMPRESNIGLYAGVGAAAAVVIILVVIIAIIFIQRRSRAQYADKSQKTALASPTLQMGNMENVCDGIYNEVEDHGATVISEKPHQDMDQSGDLYYSSVHDEFQNDPTTKDAHAHAKLALADEDETGNKMNGDLSDLYAMPDRNDSGAADSTEVHALYAMPDKNRDADDALSSADFGDLYAKPDKSRDGTDTPSSADFGDLYAKPDKNRPAPEGKEDSRMGDLYAMPDKTRPPHTDVGDDVYSTVDDPDDKFSSALANDHSGMYAEATGEFLDEHGDIEMVENELYKM